SRGGSPPRILRPNGSVPGWTGVLSSELSVAIAAEQGAPLSRSSRQDGPALIVLDRVEKTYANGTVALEDVSLEVDEGQFVSLVGPSGCGKSTLLRVIAGLGATTAGQVLVEGLEPMVARREKADMAFVFQDAPLTP